MYVARSSWVAMSLLLCACGHQTSIQDTRDATENSLDECPELKNITSEMNSELDCQLLSQCPNGSWEIGHESEERVISMNCFCDPLCLIFGDCCSNLIHQWDSVSGYLPRIPQLPPYSFECLPKLSISHIDIPTKAAYVINRCPDDWEDNIIRGKCEDPPRSKTNPYLKWPVTDTDGMLYFNMHCAQCHRKQNFQYWRIEVNCTVSPVQALDSKESVQDLLRKMLASPYCDITFQHPGKDLGYRPCKPAIKSCSHQFEDDDDSCDLVSKCHESPTAYVYGMFPSQERPVYKNIYCALCNNDRSITCKDELHVTFTLFSVLYPLSFVLDLNTGSSQLNGNNIGQIDATGMNETELVVKTCAMGEVYDHLFNVCRVLVCKEGYVLRDGKCGASEDGSIHSSTKDCLRIILNSSEFKLLPNKTIYINQSIEFHSPESYEWVDNDHVLICTNFTQNFTITRSRYSPMSKFSEAQSTVSAIGQVISIVGLSVQLMVYAVLPKLRNLAGRNLMCLSGALLCAQFFFLIGASASSFYMVCVILAVITHLAFLAAFAWMNIMAYDIWKTFSQSTKPSSEHSQSWKFIRYSVYGWGVPSLIVMTAVIINFTLNKGTVFRPAYGEVICWVGSRMGLAIFFAAPVAAILVCNLTFYILTIVNICRISRVTSRVSQKSDKKQLWLYTKLTSIMGLTWIFGFVATTFDNEVLWYLFIVFNSLQGAFICVAFVFTRQVWKLLREKHRKLQYTSVSQNPATSSDSRTRSTAVSGSVSP